MIHRTLARLCLSTALAFSAAAGAHAQSAEKAALIEASKKEGKLTVFSNVGEVNWRPVLQAFNKLYPWIKVETLDLGASEVFERFYSDHASGSSTVDIVLSSSAPQWIELAGKDMILPYEAEGADKLPDWSKPLPGVYTIATDPFVIAYNKLLLPEADWPKSLSQLAAASKAKPSEFNKRMGTYAPNSSGFSQAMFYAYAQHAGDKAVTSFEELGPKTELYRSVGPVLEKITTGEYVAGYFISGISLLPLLRDPARAQVIGWSFDQDGTVLMSRNFAISKSSKEPNAAKLFADFLVSRDGQQAVGEGGLVPYHPEVDPTRYPSGLSFESIRKAAGPDNIVVVGPDREAVEKMVSFGAKTKALFKE
jgi:iron(III) transport system substrate-binding protein